MSRATLVYALHGRIRWILLGACLLPSAPVRAQVTDGNAPRPNEFKVTVGVGAGYTSNPGLQSSNGEVNGDSTGDLRAGLADHRSSARTDWSLKYDAFYRTYASSSAFDSINHSLGYDGLYLVTPLVRLRLGESFFYSRNPLQTGVETPGSDTVVLTRQSNRWRSNSNVALDTLVSRSLTLQIGAASRNERLDLSPSIDINAYSGRVGLSKKLGREDSVSSQYTYSRFNFSGEGTTSSEANGLDFSWSHGPAEGATCALSAGVSRVLQGGASQQLFTAGAAFSHPLRQSSLVWGYHRSLDADAAIASVTVAQNAYAGLTRRIGRSGSLGVVGEYGTRDSTGGTLDAVALRYAGGAVRGSVALSPRCQLSGEARRRKQTTAEGTGDDLTVDTFLLGVVVQVF